MALAEARAAWQRTANRCLVQEDAKRAPKLACCPSVAPSVKQDEAEPTNGVGVQDIPSTGSLPFKQAPSHSNLSPNTRWWLQLQPNYGCSKSLINEQLNFSDRDTENCEIYETSQTAYFDSSFDNPCRNFETCDKKDIRNNEEGFKAFYSRNFQETCKLEVKEHVKKFGGNVLVGREFSKSENELYFDSDSSWIGAEKDTPWWRTADTEELAFLVAQRSLDFVENCDLPSPLNTRIKKDLNVNVESVGHDKSSKSSLQWRPNAVSHCSNIYDSTPGRNSCPKPSVKAEGQLLSGGDERLRFSDSPTCERLPEGNPFESDPSRAELLEALRHSQTRAREAEKAAKQACAEKEHVVKLVLRQASQLFAYKQWLHLLQVENVYFQFKNSTNRLGSAGFPVMLPWTPHKTRKTRKSWQRSRKRAKRPHSLCDAGKYAIAFALGLGLVGAGLLLGWTIGWMLPTW